MIRNNPPKREGGKMRIRAFPVSNHKLCHFLRVQNKIQFFFIKAQSYLFKNKIKWIRIVCVYKTF